MYVVTAWEDGWCIWENMYESKPTRIQVRDDMAHDGIHADDYDSISIIKENDYE